VRPRNANEWRSFWHQGGEAELRELLSRDWPPLWNASDAVRARSAERVATLLGSNAPLRALASELGRIRADDLHAEADAEADWAMADTISGWFTSRSASLRPVSPAADAKS
jgi:hypothetical protein